MSYKLSTSGLGKDCLSLCGVRLVASSQIPHPLPQRTRVSSAQSIACGKVQLLLKRTVVDGKQFVHDCAYFGYLFLPVEQTAECR
jgi:hypothetical protein